ncbi:hypothetical protein [Streptomyces cylindrosporus]|uniref:Lipoprotein n=1 Tax=Streptomyces cylindrosporus TaxID=2927583 RepID=A0ABS9Y997_9ACTN|nr:hypothetical protein [Streptomyces cylindrosporus]MCI3272491.1 hypothetical protein [Streptomyces cylindrosporus]
MPLRRSVLGVSLGVCLLACLAGCGAEGDGIRAEGPAPSRIPWSGPVYVLDWKSLARQRPDVMDLTDETVLYGMKWRGWGSPRATGTGEVVDLACLSGCPHHAYPGYAVSVVFSGLAKRQYAAYYSRASVSPVRPPKPAWAEDAGDVRLHVPKP